MFKKICIFIIIVLIILFSIEFYSSLNKKNIDDFRNIDSSLQQFEVSKIKYYSSATAVSNTTSYQNPEWNMNVYQWTDIALYLNKIKDNSNENYITKIVLENFKKSDNLQIFYLNPNNFASNVLNFDNEINDNIEYNVINSSNIDNEQNFNIPIFYQDCSNPITIRVINNLSNNYKVSKDSVLKYNGSLIRELGLNVSELDNNLEFDLKITTKDANEKLENIKLEIPFEDEQRSIIDGDFEKEIILKK